jgi:hypothetical protein
LENSLKAENEAANTEEKTETHHFYTGWFSLLSMAGKILKISGLYFVA